MLNRFRLAGFATGTLRVADKLRSGARTPEIVATQSELRLQPPPFRKRRGARSEYTKLAYIASYELVGLLGHLHTVVWYI